MGGPYIRECFISHKLYQSDGLDHFLIIIIFHVHCVNLFNCANCSRKLLVRCSGAGLACVDIR